MSVDYACITSKSLTTYKGLAQEADAQLIALQNQHAENLKQAYEAACKAALDNAIAQAQESWRNVLADSQKTVLAHKGLYEIDEVVHVPVTLYDTPVEALNHARNASYRRHGSGPQNDPSIHLAANSSHGRHSLI